MLSSLEKYPAVSVFTKYPVAPKKTASRGTAIKKVVKTVITRIVSLL